jgi:hypothetical protein
VEKVGIPVRGKKFPMEQNFLSNFLPEFYHRNRFNA